MADHFPHPSRARIATAILPFLLSLLLLSGCSNRSLTIESTPPDALVILNRREIGRTPVTVPFRYGGWQEILLIPKIAGVDEQPYLPALVLHDSSRFSLDFPVVDAFADLVGTEDHQVVQVELKPNPTPALLNNESTRLDTLDALLARADVLRSRARELFLDAPPKAPLSGPPAEDAQPAAPEEQ